MENSQMQELILNATALSGGGLFIRFLAAVDPLFAEAMRGTQDVLWKKKSQYPEIGCVFPDSHKTNIYIYIFIYMIIYDYIYNTWNKE